MVTRVQGRLQHGMHTGLVGPWLGSHGLAFWTWLGGRALGLTGTRPLTNLGGDDLLYEMSMRSSLPEAGSSAVTRWVSPISCYKEACCACY